MNRTYNAKTPCLPAILLVESDPLIRGYFDRLFGPQYCVFKAINSVEALEVFMPNASKIAVIVCGDVLNELEDDFISMISIDYPEIIKILSKPFSNTDSVIGLKCHHENFRYVTKPWDIPQLDNILFLATELFAVKRTLIDLRNVKVKALEKVLLSSRFAAYVLAPVSAGINCKRAGEAVASFVQTGVASRFFGASGTLPQRGWARLHAEQVSLAHDLGIHLSIALSLGCLNKRIAALANELEIAGAEGASGDGYLANGHSTRIMSKVDPMPALLVAPMEDPVASNIAVRVIAAYMAIYDLGGIVRRINSDGLFLEITIVPNLSEKIQLQERVSEWIVDDDLLVKEAIALD
jgi:hypothetical protein